MDQLKIEDLSGYMTKDLLGKVQTTTLWKVNIAPENLPSQKESHVRPNYFVSRAMLNFEVYIHQVFSQSFLGLYMDHVSYADAMTGRAKVPGG